MNRSTTNSGDAARVLVIDDDPLFSKKITRAIIALGHDATAVDSGKKGLSALKSGSFDAVLLDIVMPELDGFEVLKSIKHDPSLHDTPIIIVSALQSETPNVVHAIELGAEDFLPKDFDLVILQARLTACISKKRFRDTEKEYYGQIERLTQAASRLESGVFNPEELALEDIAKLDSPMGRLAGVFQGMAGEIFERERKARQSINMLKASIWMIVMAAIFGLTPSLGRIASTLESTPLGLLVWTFSLGGIILLSIAAYQGNLPKLRWRDLVFFLVWAVISGVGFRMAVFVSSTYIQAAMVSLIIAMQGFIVFALASCLRIEKATPRRLTGLLVGFVGVGIALSDRLNESSASLMVWFGVAILAPLCLAIDALLISRYKPKHIDFVPALGLMMLMTVLLVAPFAYLRGDLMPLSWDFGKLELVIFLLVLVPIASYVMSYQIIKIAGVVFYGQSAYLTTTAGVFWGMLLLNESLSSTVWIALGIILLGMYMVNPRQNDKDLVIKRNFTNSHLNTSA